jgi:hypothetical protein
MAVVIDLDGARVSVGGDRLSVGGIVWCLGSGLGLR